MSREFLPDSLPQVTDLLGKLKQLGGNLVNFGEESMKNTENMLNVEIEENLPDAQGIHNIPTFANLRRYSTPVISSQIDQNLANEVLSLLPVAKFSFCTRNKTLVHTLEDDVLILRDLSTVLLEVKLKNLRVENFFGKFKFGALKMVKKQKSFWSMMCGKKGGLDGDGEPDGVILEDYKERLKKYFAQEY